MTNNILKAKAELILDQPFFASLLCSMPIVADDGIPTMATNGAEIRYNPEFMGKLSLPETVFVLSHEVLHCAFQHMFRRGSRDAKRWNIAADYVINDILVKEKLGAPVDGALINSELVKAGNGNAEGVYALLPEPPAGEDAPGAGEKGGALDDVRDGGKDPAENAAKEAEMRVKVVQAANAAKMCGKLSGGLERLVKAATASRVDWKAILRRFLSERSKTELSYARPNRRFMAEDVCLPSMSGEKLGEITVAVDCSGSVSEETLAVFASEIRAIIQDTAPALTRIVYFDSGVLRADTYGPDDSIEIKPIGGGGTAFAPIFEYLESVGASPTACVVLTDLYASDFGKAPAYPVLWASYGATDAPFGEILTVKAS